MLKLAIDRHGRNPEKLRRLSARFRRPILPNRAMVVETCAPRAHPANVSISLRDTNSNEVLSDGLALPRSFPSNTLDNDGWRHAARGTHGHEASFEVATLQLIQNSANQDGAGRANRMTERDRSAIDVDLGAVKIKIPNEFLGYDRKGLVDLEQVDIAQREPRLSQHLARRRDRRVQHQRGRDGERTRSIARVACYGSFERFRVCRERVVPNQGLPNQGIWRPKPTRHSDQPP